MRIWRFFTAASLLGAGAVAMACSSSSSGGGGGSPEGGTGEGGDDGGSVDAACPPSDAPNVATFDSGSKSWACIQSKCTDLPACAADCMCNAAIAGALQCVVSMGGADASSAATQSCFVTAFGMAGTGMEVSGLVTCLTNNAGTCAGIIVDAGEGGTHEGGGSEGGGSEGGSEAGTEGGTDGGGE